MATNPNSYNPQAWNGGGQGGFGGGQFGGANFGNSNVGGLGVADGFNAPVSNEFTGMAPRFSIANGGVSRNDPRSPDGGRVDHGAAYLAVGA